MNDKQKPTYDYWNDINQDYRGNKAEILSLLKKWEESPESELRTRLLKELNEELGSN